MARTYCTSKLMFLGSSDTLAHLQKPEFLHQYFFLLCTTREECTKKVNEQANIVLEIDIFLPDTAVDLIHAYRQELSDLRIQFYLYCSTDDLVNQYRTLTVSKICEQVFNVNQMEEKLYKVAHPHLLRCMNYLEQCAHDGDDDARDLLLPITDLFEQNATIISDMIRQRAGLPQQPTEFEEG